MTSSSDRFVVGFVSTPHPHSVLHMKTLDVLDAIETVHVCGLEGEDVDMLAAETDKVASTTDNLGELLARDDIDALVVSVRNDVCPMVLEAGIAAGKGSLFEKPGALCADDLRRIMELAKARGLVMGAMFQNRTNPKVVETREARRDGALGTVMAVEGRMVTSQVRYRDPNHWLFRKGMSGSGILSWLGCHHIDLMSYMMEEPRCWPSDSREAPSARSMLAIICRGVTPDTPVHRTTPSSRFEGARATHVCPWRRTAIPCTARLRDGRLLGSSIVHFHHPIRRRMAASRANASWRTTCRLSGQAVRPRRPSRPRSTY